MAPKDDTHLVADPKNGIVTPLYSDRQVVRASDLTLDRESHDAALARMRRLMHGHGIVSGFDMARHDGDPAAVVLSPGYAVAPSGAEIFLPQAVTLTELPDRIRAHCNPDTNTCEDLTAEDQAETAANIGLARLMQHAWLVARPAADPTDPRPGVPAGCENPGNLQLPTRLCHMVRLELMCGLPEDKVLKGPSCPTLNTYICEGGIRGEATANPYPPMPDADCDFLVLGLIILRSKANANPAVGNIDGEQEVVPALVNRRTVLSNVILQDFLHSCVCPALHSQEPSQPAEPQSDSTPTPVPTPEDDPVITKPGWDIYLPDREHLAEAVLIAKEIDRLRGLEGTPAGTPEGFLRADPEELVIATGLTVPSILTMKEEIVATEAFWKTEDSAPAVSGDWGDFNARMFDSGVNTNWNATTNALVSESLREQPMIVGVAESPAALEEKGLSGPADVVAKSDRELAVTLGVTEPVARAIKADMMRFTGLMGQ